MTGKTKEQIEDMFADIVAEILHIPDDDQDTIRFPFGSRSGTGSAPGNDDRDRDMVFIHVTPGSDPYGEPHHISYKNTDPGSPNLTYVDEYSEVHLVRFVCYGPHSDVWSVSIRNGLLTLPVQEALHRNKFSIRFPIPVIQFIPEPKGGEWWKRNDLMVTFYEAVRVEIPNSVRTIETFDIRAVPESGKE